MSVSDLSISASAPSVPILAIIYTNAGLNTDGTDVSGVTVGTVPSIIVFLAMPVYSLH